VSKTFIAKSPTRVDLAGGTLDLWPLNCFVENCVTINVAISIFTECELKIRDDEKIVVASRDQGFKHQFNSWNEFVADKKPELHFFRVHANFWKPSCNWGFEITTNSQSPLGGGLGGSSSLSMSVMKTFMQATGKNFSLKEMVSIGHNLEASILRTPTGVQDYVPAIQGGINALYFSPSGFEISRLKVDLDFYNDHALLVYTGRPHHSGLNNFEVMKNSVVGNEVTLRALRGIRDVALELHDKLEKKDTKDLKKIFNKEYDCRIQLTSAFTSPEIERLRKVSLDAGADAIKICGAGGGGCVMVWCDPKNKSKVNDAITQSGFKVMDTVGVNV
jgi:D-glycero-alpha-D-manno-heptose-7-phosphate kinase